MPSHRLRLLTCMIYYMTFVWVPAVTSWALYGDLEAESYKPETTCCTLALVLLDLVMLKCGITLGRWDQVIGIYLLPCMNATDCTFILSPFNIVTTCLYAVRCVVIMSENYREYPNGTIISPPPSLSLLLNDKPETKYTKDSLLFQSKKKTRWCYVSWILSQLYFI